jgi:hypothetical protein
MNMPAFIAEASLAKTSMHYRVGAKGPARSMGLSSLPQRGSTGSANAIPMIWVNRGPAPSKVSMALIKSLIRSYAHQASAIHRAAAVVRVRRRVRLQMVRSQRIAINPERFHPSPVRGVTD